MVIGLQLYVVNQPNSGILVNDAVRLMSIQQPLFSSTTALQRSIQELELSTTLATNITATDTSNWTVDDATLVLFLDGGLPND